MAYYNREKQAGRSRRDEARRRRLIQLGSRDVAARILGNADPILASISSDPNSTSDFGRVLKQYNDMLRGIDESTSFENTFWGTGRATGYQQSAYTRQQTEADLIKGAEGDIQSYEDAYAQMLRQLETERRQAENDAWMRQMWANLFSSQSSGGTSGSTSGATAPNFFAPLANADPAALWAATLQGQSGAPMPSNWNQLVQTSVQSNNQNPNAIYSPAPPPQQGGGTGNMEFPYSVSGYSNEQIYAYAQSYAASRAGYSPHMLMQEGTITYQNGQPGVMIKYNTPNGSSTEWTPIG